MLLNITSETVFLASSVAEELSSVMEERFDVKLERPFLEILQEQLNDPKISLYAFFSPQGEVTGIAIANDDSYDPSHGHVQLFYVQGTMMTEGVSEDAKQAEAKFFSEFFEQLKGIYESIICELSFLTPTLYQLMTRNGFTNHPRILMSLSVEKIPPNQAALPRCYSLRPLLRGEERNLAELLVDLNRGGLDTIIFPFFQSVEGTKNFVQTFMSQTNQGCHQVLEYKGIPVGVCLVEPQDPKTAFISEVGLILQHRGKGLGRALLTHTLHSIRSIEPQVEKICLAVTEENSPALGLYKSMGFGVERRSHALVWKRPSGSECRPLEASQVLNDPNS